MNKWHFAVLCIPVLLGSALLADDSAPQVNFDRGADVEKTIESIGEQARLLPFSKTRLQRPLSALKAPDFAITGRIIGMDLPPRVLNSEPYKAALKYPPLIEDLPPEVRDPLKAEWSNINATRASLLSEANDLEREDQRLYAQGVELDRNAERLGRQAEQLEAEIDDFNRRCTGRPLPPDEYNACLRWRSDLIRRIDSHNAETREHNNRVLQWRRDVGDLRKRAGATLGKLEKRKALPFLPRVVQWEQHGILPWIAAAKKALESACRKPFQIEVKPPVANVPTGGNERHFEAIVFFRENPIGAPECPVDIFWTLVPHPDVPNTSIGTLAPRSGKITTFRSGNFTGVGEITCQDLNSGVGTGATVNVYNPAAQ